MDKVGLDNQSSRAVYRRALRIRPTIRGWLFEWSQVVDDNHRISWHM